MLKTFDKIYLTESPRRIVLMLLIIFGCQISALAQIFSTSKIVELLNTNIIQIDILVIERLSSDIPINWLLLEGNASIVVQGGNRNQVLIEQVRGTGNVAKVLQQGYHNRAGYEYTDRKEYGVYQAGNRNYSAIEQFGNHNSSETLQYGYCNEINIVQHGGTGFLIDYKSYVNKSIVTHTGNGNTAIIIQTYYP